jgi:hypothetical protein
LTIEFYAGSLDFAIQQGSREELQPFEGVHAEAAVSPLVDLVEAKERAPKKPSALNKSKVDISALIGDAFQ